MKKIKNKIIKFILYFLKVRCLGLYHESDLPPEFVVTKHAKERLTERGWNKKDRDLEDIMASWYYGINPPPDFDTKQYRHQFWGQNLVYRYYKNKVYVWVVRKGPKGGKAPYTIKFLITVLPVY
jgi:hypothetical protein